MPFPPNKNADELGIDRTRKFVMVESNGNFDKGDVLILKMDDHSSAPWFERLFDEKRDYASWFRLDYYNEPEATKNAKPHEVKVGDKFELLEMEWTVKDYEDLRLHASTKGKVFDQVIWLDAVQADKLNWITPKSKADEFIDWIFPKCQLDINLIKQKLIEIYGE